MTDARQRGERAVPPATVGASPDSAFVFFDDFPNPAVVDWEARTVQASKHFERWFVARLKVNRDRLQQDVVHEFPDWQPDASRASVAALERWLGRVSQAERYDPSSWTQRVGLQRCVWDDTPRRTKDTVYDWQLTEQTLFRCALVATCLGESRRRRDEKKGTPSKWRRRGSRWHLDYGQVVLGRKSHDGGWEWDEDPIGDVTAAVRDSLRDAAEIDLHRITGLRRHRAGLRGGEP